MCSETQKFVANLMQRGSESAPTAEEVAQMIAENLADAPYASFLTESFDEPAAVEEPAEVAEAAEETTVGLGEGI